MPDLLKMCDITLEQLDEIYRREKSVKRVAKVLGVSRPTVTKWLRIAGTKTLGHRPPILPTTSMVGEYGIVAKWIVAHPREKLPRSVREAAKIIGCSPSTVWNYFYRRKKRVIRYIESLGKLNKVDIVLETTDGRRISSKYIDSYKYTFRPVDYTLKIAIVIKGVYFACEYKLKPFLTMMRESLKV